jgi:hypothetical protein
MGMSPRTFYRKYIKTCKSLQDVDLPNDIDVNEIRIEKTVFPNDWRLYYRKTKYIQCKSELEARYLKVWLKHGLTHIEIPKDEKYLAEITPIVENVEQRVYQIAEEKLAGYREVTQKKIIDGLWLEVHDDDFEEPPPVKHKKKTKERVKVQQR